VVNDTKGTSTHHLHLSQLTVDSVKAFYSVGPGFDSRHFKKCTEFVCEDLCTVDLTARD